MNESDDANAEIDALYASWRDAYERRDVEAVMALLTEDYVLWATDAAPMGRDALRPLFASVMDQYDIEPAFEREERIVSGDLAFERGWDVQHVRPRAGGEGRSQRHRVFLILRRGPDDKWRFARGMSQARLK
jgi:uncharacterized protein (TIGR02246 family)